MSHGHVSLVHFIDHRLRQGQNAQRIGDIRPAFADFFGEFQVREMQGVDRELVGLCFLDNRQILALDILKQGQFSQVLIVIIAHNGRNGRESGELRRFAATLAGNEHVAISDLFYDHRLQHTVDFYRFGEFGERPLVKMLPGLEGIGADPAEFDVDDFLFVQVTNLVFGHEIA